MILLSGDFHAGSVNELSFICKSRLKDVWEEKYNFINWQIILGDAGWLWPKNDKTDKYNLKQLEHNKWPILYLPGNHEPIYGRDLSEFKETDFGFGYPAYEILPNIFYLPRGFIYTIEKLRFAVLGGGLSIDKSHRIENLSWWAKEQWSFMEEKECLDRMTNQEVDYVLSHAGPNTICETLFQSEIRYSGAKFSDRVAIFNDELDKVLKYKEWFFAHWHYDRNKDHYHCLYQSTALIDDTSWEIAP
jgi:hypothetical protein